MDSSMFSRCSLPSALLAGKVSCVLGEDSAKVYRSFWSYELSKRMLISEKTDAEKPEWMTILLCGGIAGVVTWASIFPLGMLTVVSFGQ